VGRVAVVPFLQPGSAHKTDFAAGLKPIVAVVVVVAVMVMAGCYHCTGMYRYF